MMSDPRWYARAFDSAYLEVYAHRDSEEAERATRRLLESLELGGRRVLDLACGAGRHARAVARRGATVVGLDLSVELLARASQAPEPDAPPVTFVRGDMRHLPFASGSFNIVLSMFTSFGYFANEADDRGMLAEVRRVLVPGGVFLLDVFNAEHVRRNLVPETHRSVGRFEVFERRRVDAGRDVVVKQIELRDGSTTHRYEEVVRMWSRPRLEAALQSAALDVEHARGDYDGSDFDPNHSPRLILRARARDEA